MIGIVYSVLQIVKKYKSGRYAGSMTSVTSCTLHTLSSPIPNATKPSKEMPLVRSRSDENNIKVKFWNPIAKHGNLEKLWRVRAY